MVMRSDLLIQRSVWLFPDHHGLKGPEGNRETRQEDLAENSAGCDKGLAMAGGCSDQRSRRFRWGLLPLEPPPRGLCEPWMGDSQEEGK